MSGKKILSGLTEALAHAKGNSAAVERRVVVESNVDVRNLRKKLSLTQQEFALQFGFTVAAVRHWEQGTRIPEMSARVLLTLIERDPEYVRNALGLKEENQKMVAYG